MLLAPLTGAPLRAQGAAGAGAEQPVKVKVEITGLEGAAESNVRVVLRLARAADQGKLLPERVRQLDGRAQQDIEQGLEPFGFYRPKVRKSIKEEGKDLVVRYAIDPGPPVIVRRVDLKLTGEGAASPAFQKMAGSFPLKQGDTLQHRPYDISKLALLTLASDSGYLAAKFDTNQVRVDRLAGTADIVLHFDTGPRYRFGQVTFVQNILDTNFLSTRIPFEPGELYRNDRLLKLQANLVEDPFFSSVEVVPHAERAGPNLEVPIEVRLTARKPRSYEGGLGYGTDTGPRGSLKANLRRLNRRGHNMEFTGTLSAIEQSAQVEYAIPAALGHTSSLNFVAGFARLAPDVSTSTTYILGSRLSERWWGWRETFSLGVQRAGFRVGVDTGVSVILAGILSAERLQANNRVYPSRGLRVRFDVGGGPEFAFFTETFVQAKASGKVIRSLNDHLRLLARADAGHTWTPSFRTLPPTLRFFAGGSQSVRGYSYESIGPKDELGNVIGAPNLLVGSLEADYRVVPRWAGAVFFDAGNATNGWSLSLKKGIGAGIRWISPIGLVRLDGAYALDEPDQIGSSRWRIHFSMGPDL